MQSRSVHLFGLVIATALLSAAPAAAEPAAIEEYVLTLPGVSTSGVGESEPLVDLAQRAGPVGVTGEAAEPPTTLGAISNAAVSPAGAVVLAAAAAGLFLLHRRRAVT